MSLFFRLRIRFKQFTTKIENSLIQEMLMRFLVVILIGLSLSSCGTFTPIPSHGGGKRFAMEQVLVSASIRKVISEIPIEQLRDKKVLFETN